MNELKRLMILSKLENFERKTLTFSINFAAILYYIFIDFDEH